MNIWLINHYAVPPPYYPLIRQYNFGKYLLRKGHTVTIFAASTVHNSDINLITDNTPYKKTDVDGIKYVIIKCHGYTGNGLKRVLNMYEFARKLPKVCDKFERPDAIVSTSMPPMSCAAGVKIAKKYGCRNIAEIADLWPESLIVYGIAGPNNLAVIHLRHLEKWIYKNADDVIFTMGGAYDYIKEQHWEKEIPRSKVHYINNGVDLEQFIYNKEHYTIDDPDLNDRETFKVVYTGSIRKVNNLGLLLDVAKQINDPKIKILIWGNGDEKPALEKRVKEELITNVVFKGVVEKKYVPYIVSKADLNLAHNNPSRLFRFGISFNKIFDFLAAGKPVFCDFPCKYNPVIEYKAGKDTELFDAKSVAKGIESFAEMSETEYRQYCNNTLAAAKKFDFSVLTEELMKVINLTIDSR